MAYHQQSYYQTTSLPIAVPHKQPYYASPPTHGPYAVSPPEAPESVSTGTGTYGHSAYSATSPSYAGSASGGEYDSSASANGVDMQEYMQDRFSSAFDPLPLDRTLAVQAQTSGLLNAKHRELLELQQLAQQRLARSRARLAEGYADAKEVRRDLEWTQKRVSTMKTKASKKNPEKYKQARARYPSPEY